MYVEEKIGDSYQQWVAGDRVKIMAPTGSGKSHFILYILLDHAVRHGYRILYLVNRKILKRQLVNELQENIAGKFYNKYKVDLKNYIWIRTYQEIENEIKRGTCLLNNFNPTYIVCDECHYFYSDSDFNTSTELSYEYLTRFDKSVYIFMSATMENVQCKIDASGMFDASGIETPTPIFIRNKYTIELPIDYAYVHLHCIDDEKDIPAIIEERTDAGEKWLIFIDSIKKGEMLKKSLCVGGICQESNISFINADYEQDEDAKKSVEELAVNSLVNKKIVITTSVMDNGISFEDQELRNLLIMADSKEEFIQMLGRKRQDGEQVNVYICRRNKEYFKRRKEYVDRTLKYYDRYGQQIKFMNRMLYQRHLEYLGIQQTILDDMLSSENIYKNIRKFCFVLKGVVSINYFSIEKLYKSQSFYKEMIDAITSDPDAFVKQQAKWLEILDEKVERVILDSAEKKLDRVKEHLLKYLDKLMEDKESIELTIELNTQKLKKDNKDAFLYLLERANEDGERENEIKNLKKTDRPIQPDDFNTCMRVAGLSYDMRKEGKKFIIAKKER